MLNFDARVKNSDAAQPRVTNVKPPTECETSLTYPVCRTRDNLASGRRDFSKSWTSHVQGTDQNNTGDTTWERHGETMAPESRADLVSVNIQKQKFWFRIGISLTES